MKTLIDNLKTNGEDYEFYPTSKEMVKTIYKYLTTNSEVDILDIGCGNGNFKKKFEELAEEEYHNKKVIYGEDSNVLKNTINKYYVIEKSKILLESLDKDTIVLGTNFHTDMLIDKPVENVFCNPPYSEFEQWTLKILDEANCYDAFMVIPKRWRENTKINKLIERRNISAISMGEFDFEDAERRARAKVEIVRFNKKTPSRHRGKDLETINEESFNDWFDNTFNIEDEEKENDYRFRDIEEEAKNNIKSKLVCEQKDKAKNLVMLYEDELNTLFNNFKAICSMDIEVLKTIGIDKKKLKEAIKQKTTHLKNIYWKCVFDELDEITSRLTIDSRREMLDKFTELRTVDFTLTNIYSLILWVIKNANEYYNDQLIKFYKELSDRDNITPYKSNLRVFKNEDWRFNKYHSTHYTLDYRIIVRGHTLGISRGYGFRDNFRDWEFDQKISDVKTIANNLGFTIHSVERPRNFGEKCYAYGFDGEIMFEFKCYKNENVHLKLNMELAKAMNVEVARLLGWIKSKEDIKEEFNEEMSKGAEKYFKVNNHLQLSDLNLMIGEQKDES